MRAWWWVGAVIAVAVAASLYRAAEIRAALAQIGPAWDRLNPDVQRRVQSVIADANAEFEIDGLRVGMHDGWRSVDAQQSHMARGASFVSASLNSYHVWGLAADFVFLDRLGRWTWLGDDAASRDRWYRLGVIIERHGFEWGGRWDVWGGPSFDGPHAQLPLRRVADLRAAYSDPLDYVEGVA